MNAEKKVLGKNTILNFVASLEKNYNLNPSIESAPLVDFILSKKYRHIAVVLLDGLGVSIIDANTSNGSIFRTHQIAHLSSLYPPTTVAVTTALRTGRYPIDSGWLGWCEYLEKGEDAQILFKDEGYYNGKPSKKPATEILPVDYWYNNLKRAKAYEIWPSFREGGAANFNEAVDRLLNNLNAEEANFTYLYWNEPDYTIHDYGVKNQIVKVKIAELEEGVLKLAENLPNDSCVFIIADHGLIDVEPIYLIDSPLKNLLEKPISCEGRCCFFHVKANQKEEFKSQFEALYGEFFKLYTYDEIIKAKLLGAAKPNALAKSIIGDYVAVGVSDKMFVWSKDQHTFNAHHAGLTDAEVDIPLILLKRKDAKEEAEEVKVFPKEY